MIANVRFVGFVKKPLIFKQILLNQHHVRNVKKTLWNICNFYLGSRGEKLSI